MRLNVADFAFKGVDLEKPETMKGIGISMESIAPVLLDAYDVCARYEMARERGQRIEPTAVRLAIARLRATLRASESRRTPGDERP